MRKRIVLAVAGGLVLGFGVLASMGQAGGLTNVFLKAIATAVETLDNAIKVDDAAFTPGTTSVSMMGAEFDDASPDSVDEGDAGAPRMSANRNLYMRIRDNAGNERGANVDASNQLTVVEASGAAIALDTAEMTGGAVTFQTPVAVNQAAAGRTTILALEATKVIYLHALVGTMDVAGTVIVYYDDDGAGTNEVALTGNMAFAATGGVVIPFNANTNACLRTAAGKQLTIVTTGGAFDGYAIVSKTP